MRPRFHSLLVPALAAVSLSACHHAKPPEPTPVPAAAPPPAPTTSVLQDIRPVAAPPVSAPAPDPNAAAKALAAAIAEMANTIGTAVYFDYDKSDLREDGKAALDVKVPILQANKQVRVRIAGNTDERGSDEYNLALGQRRAAAAKAYLVARGIDAGRIDIVSFGEERPAQQGDNEAALAGNRRDEFEIVAGRDTMQPVRR